MVRVGLAIRVCRVGRNGMAYALGSVGLGLGLGAGVVWGLRPKRRNKKRPAEDGRRSAGYSTTLPTNWNI